MNENRNEVLFFDAFARNYPKPRYLKDISRASPRLDALGVDAIALVVYQDGEEVRVPIQLKGTRAQVDRYYIVHPEAFRAKVIVLVVDGDMSPQCIRARLYEKLEATRMRNIKFEDYLKRLENQPLPSCAKRFSKIIAERRSTERARQPQAAVTPAE